MDDVTKSLYATPLNESVLLLDETAIEQEHGIQRQVIPGKKVPFIMEPDQDKPWECRGTGMGKGVGMYGTVFYDKEYGKYRMWYHCRMGPHWRYESGNYQIPGLYVPRTDAKPYSCNGVTEDKYGRAFVDNDRGDLVCYAESDDGINWVKPNLGVFTFDGSPDNNIVWDLHTASVFVDHDRGDPNKKYKAIGFCRRYRNIFLISSPDGIHWDDSDYLEPVARRHNEGTFNVTYDARDGIYRAYSITRYRDEERRRVICYAESPSLEGPWKEAQPTLEPTNWDDEMARRKYGALRAEFHNLSAFRYNNLHLGLVGVLYVTAEQIPGQKNQMPCNGPIDAQFMYSRDGINWQHADRERTAAIPRGGEGAFDRGVVAGTAKEPLIEGDEVHWYYAGSEQTHGAALETHVSKLGRATWQRDRFVALRADKDGLIVTRALCPPEGVCDLEINADASKGQILAELCASDGRVLPGFSRQECISLTGDDMRWRVKWQAGDIASVKEAFKIRFILKDARIYSFTFCKE